MVSVGGQLAQAILQWVFNVSLVLAIVVHITEIVLTGSPFVVPTGGVLDLALFFLLVLALFSRIGLDIRATFRTL